MAVLLKKKLNAGTPSRPVKRRGIALAKGGKLPPGIIRTWGGKQYIKSASGEWKRYVVEKYDSSDARARQLTNSDFGTPESVREQARIIRTASNRQEATQILKEIIKRGPYTSKSGLTARIPGKSIGKMVSSEAVNTSFLPEAHYLAVANIDKLFPNAIEPWNFALNPGKNNDGLKSRRYLYAPMKFHDRIVVVKFTVKEYINPDIANKMYSIEAIDTQIE